VAINPATPVGVLAEITDAIDMALCMTINPGWGGQRFIEHSLEKLPRVRAILSEDVAVEVDGGINPTTAPKCRQAGANVFVAGSAIFSSADPGEAYLAIARSLQTD
jgi:ribulose-phosphate 3-epimerase